MMELGVDIVTSHGLRGFDGNTAEIECSYTGERKNLDVEAVVSVTLRAPDDALFHELQRSLESGGDYRPDSVTRIGDCLTPTIIAGAVFSGHRYARELDTEVDPDNRMKYDRVFYDDA
jgi:dimethylamine/trimethylamine dehydrogenase